MKLRGFRIELGEIEAVLRAVPRGARAWSLLREDRPGDKRLVGYFVAEDKEIARQAELRGYLKQKLPEYMVPSAFVTLEALPLTPNGKVDRRALPAPDAGRPELEHAYAAPRTPAWKNVGGNLGGDAGVGAGGHPRQFLRAGGAFASGRARGG